MHVLMHALMRTLLLAGALLLPAAAAQAQDVQKKKSVSASSRAGSVTAPSC